MKFRYITIEREYGSGGTKIARRLSEVSGVPCYGREILEAVAKKQGIPVERINQYEEKATGSLIYSMFVMSRVQTGDPNMLTKEGKVFLDEQLEIRRLAMEGPAIFLGHCASDALRDQKGVIKVFIHSENEEEVKNRIAKDYGIAPGDVESTRRFYNKKRAGYFRANTGNEWKDLKNYDVVLDSAKLEPDIGNQYGWGFQHSLQQRACYRPDKCIGGTARKENCTYSRRNHSPEPKWRKSETGIDFRTVFFGKDYVQQTSQYSVNDQRAEALSDFTG